MPPVENGSLAAGLDLATWCLRIIRRVAPKGDLEARILTLPPDREPSSARSGPERNGARKQIQRYVRS